MGVKFQILGRRRSTALVNRFARDDSGATAIEYGLIVALIFLAIVGAIRSYTSTTSDMYGTIEQTLDDASN